MKPISDYIYAKELLTETGVVSVGSIENTKQRYQVISVGPGKFEFGTFITPDVKKGDVVIIQKHAAEGDTPPEMLNRGYALFMASRVMAVEEE